MRQKDDSGSQARESGDLFGIRTKLDSMRAKFPGGGGRRAQARLKRANDARKSQR